MRRSALHILSTIHFSDNKLLYQNKGKLANSIGRKISTVEKLLELLSKKGYIKRKKVYGEKYLELTNKGKNEVEKFFHELSFLYFTPENHGIDYPVRIIDLINTIVDPYTKIFLISLYNKRKKINLLSTLKGFSLITSKYDTVNLMNAVFNPYNDMKNLEYSFMRFNYIGFTKNSNIIIEYCNPSDLEGCLIYADTSIRNGNIKDAKKIFSNLLKHYILPRNIRFICELGIARIFFHEGDINKAIKHLEHIKNGFSEKLAVLLLNQYKADWLSSNGQDKEAEILFLKLINSTDNVIVNSFIYVMILNNYGVLKYNQRHYNDAYEYWKKARKKAHLIDAKYMESILITNLASYFRIKNKWDLANSLLKEAEEYYEKMGLMEGISLIHFNKALLSISMCNYEEGVEQYQKSISGMFPSKIIKQDWGRSIKNTLHENHTPLAIINKFENINK